MLNQSVQFIVYMLTQQLGDKLQAARAEVVMVLVVVVVVIVVVVAVAAVVVIEVLDHSIICATTHQDLKKNRI